MLFKEKTKTKEAITFPEFLDIIEKDGPVLIGEHFTFRGNLVQRESPDCFLVTLQGGEGLYYPIPDVIVKFTKNDLLCIEKNTGTATPIPSANFLENYEPA